MKQEAKDIENFILLGYKSKRNCSVEKNILMTGHGFSLGIFTTWVVCHFFVIFGDYTQNTLSLVLCVNIALLALSPIMIMLAIKLCKNRLKSIHSVKKQHRKYIPYITTAATIGAAVGAIFFRFFLSGSTPNESITIFVIFCLVLILIFFFVGAISYYKIYLIRKFCPYLKNRH